ncbi:MAG TPA: polysaccharide biosynthesis protein [Clostridiales bacterium]|jgi:stage V sporulation protein B|nr:polysaccharide biosynthesis protein [Clostridiales bacterium]
MTKKSFLQGAAVLGGAGLIIKFLGAVFRIPLANIIGDTGMSYYQTSYPVYVLLLTLSTAGIPVAISRMVSEREAIDQFHEAYRVFRLSFWLLLGIGLASFAMLFFGARPIVTFLKNPEAYYAMRAIAPALLIVPLMAAFRGYFQGQQDMKPTAVSQVIEQVVRVGAGLTLAVLLFTRSLPLAAAGASFGATAGAGGGLIAILAIYFYRREALRRKIESQSSHVPREASRRILSQILIIAVPITIGASIMPIMNTIDVAIVMRRLTATGFSPAEAKALFGQLSGMVGPLINLPQVLTQAIAMSLVPAIAAHHRRQEIDQLQHNIELGFRAALILGVPSALGMMALAKPIMLLLYPAQPESAVNGALSLFILAFGILFLASVQTLTGVLQGIGQQMIPVRNLAIGAGCKVVVTYALTGIETININGAAIGTVIAYIVASTLNMMAVCRLTGARFNFQLTFFKPLLAGLTMAVAARILYVLLEAGLSHLELRASLTNAAATGGAVLFGGLVYGFMLLAARAVSEEELKLLPKGEKLTRLFKRYKKR